MCIASMYRGLHIEILFFIVFIITVVHISKNERKNTLSQMPALTKGKICSGHFEARLKKLDKEV